jgi:hypothetical protein
VTKNGRVDRDVKLKGVLLTPKRIARSVRQGPLPVGRVCIGLAWLVRLHVGLTATLDFIVRMKRPFFDASKSEPENASVSSCISE